MEWKNVRFIKKFMDYNVGKVDNISKEQFNMLSKNGYVEEYVKPSVRKKAIMERLSARFEEIVNSLEKGEYNYVESLLTMQSGYDVTVDYINLKDIFGNESEEYEYDMSALIEVLKMLDEEA